ADHDGGGGVHVLVGRGQADQLHDLLARRQPLRVRRLDHLVGGVDRGDVLVPVGLGLAGGPAGDPGVHADRGRVVRGQRVEPRRGHHVRDPDDQGRVHRTERQLPPVGRVALGGDQVPVEVAGVEVEIDLRGGRRGRRGRTGGGDAGPAQGRQRGGRGPTDQQ